MTNHIMRTAGSATLGLVLAFTFPAFAADFFAGTDPGFPAAVGDPSVLPEGAKLMKVFNGGCVLTEGVAAGHDGMMYFSDLTFTSRCKDASGLYLQAGNIFQLRTVVSANPLAQGPVNNKRMPVAVDNQYFAVK